MNGINWLASYPKSGNTWLRVFFTNLRRGDAGPANINDLDRGLLASSRELFDEAIGYETADLTHAEVDRLRPEVYLHLAARAEAPLFVKVHDAYTFLADGRPLFPPQATAGAIYLIRNPLDVCVAFAHHTGTDNCEAVIDRMANPHFAQSARTDRLDAVQLRMRMLTWSDHVLSWVNAPNLRTLVIRYEDMHARPVETFTAAAGFVGMTQDREQITRALAYSSFEELQRQEKKQGFREAAGGRSFFRKGKVGSWREVLTPAQVARIIRDHRDVMQRFGYLDEAKEAGRLTA